MLGFPGVNLCTQTVGPGLHALAGGSADGDHSSIWIAHRNVFTTLIEVKIKIGKHIDLVDQHHIADGKHQRILEWLVITLRDGEDHGVL